MKGESGYFYHVYNRGVDGRKIFQEPKDYLRFIHDLYEFNDENPALPYKWVKKKREEFGLQPERRPIVNILCFCLMPNHYHLLIQPCQEDGVTKFMRKLGTGYTMYFNTKYQRSGALFQGKFKHILIKSERYFLHLTRYIHLNPLDLFQSDWREKGIRNLNKARVFLEKYRWSSFLDYTGKKNFSSVICQDLICSLYPEGDKYKQFVLDYVKTDLEKIKDLILEDL